jgi:predicted nucleic acid-binding protein
MEKLKIYLDNCCYNRPFDDSLQEKIKLEADAVLYIINLSKSGKLIIVSSQFVKYEIDCIRVKEKRDKVLDFYHCDEYHVLNNGMSKLAKYYQTFNLKTFDSLHLAAAESAKADYLLTTDIDFIQYSKRFTHNVKVINPCDFLKEELVSLLHSDFDSPRRMGD